MEENMKLYKINGYWKESGIKFFGFLVCDEVPEENIKDAMFRTNMNEEKIKELIDLGEETNEKFVIENYDSIKLSEIVDGGGDGKRIDVKHCKGCYNDFYNYLHDGKRCWHFDSARLVLRKEVHVDQVPPWTQEPIEVPTCYRKPKYVYIDPKNER